jgi:hypothetical protein
MERHNPARIESVPGQESFCREHGVRVGVIEALCLSSPALKRTLQLLHEPVTARVKRIFFRFQGPSL